MVGLFKKLLSFKSITPNDDGAMEFIKNYLDEYEVMELNKNGVKNLFLYKKFGDGEHLCFAGHIDVVPPGEGWNTPPFSPTEIDGNIFARGAQDMKSGVASFLYALKHTKTFNGTLSTIITSDEEGDAKYGTIEVLKELKKIDMLPKYAVVAEPTCEVKFGDAIKVGRRGSINGVLKIFGKQGHAAYPEKAINPVNLLAPILPKIAGKNLDDGDEYFAPSQFVITDIRGGMEVTNVTPNEVKIMFNVRNNTLTDKNRIENFIKENFEGINYSLTLSQSAKPFVTNRESKIVKSLDKAINNVVNIKTKYSTAGGTSDARFFGEYGVDTVEFGVINDTIHSVNERTSIKEVENLTKIFQTLIKEWS